MNFSDYVVSLIRTWVPVGVGAVLAWISTKVGFIVDEDTKNQGILFFTFFLTGLYYAIIRWLERQYPQIGWLLGLAKQPGYVPTDEQPPSSETNSANRPRGPPGR